jgi:hypothetical protein
MTYTAQEAYDAIKNLESEDLIPLTLPSVTINVGTLDAATGQFHYSIPVDKANWFIPGGIGPHGSPLPKNTDGDYGRDDRCACNEIAT